MFKRVLLSHDGTEAGRRTLRRGAELTESIDWLKARDRPAARGGPRRSERHWRTGSSAVFLSPSTPLTTRPLCQNDA
jgi:hypothetical protein